MAAGDQQQRQDTKSTKKNLKFIETNHEQGWNSRKTLFFISKGSSLNDVLKFWTNFHRPSP